ncbi:N-acyl homoserine lactonase family protein [Rhodococcus sp. 2H158]
MTSTYEVFALRYATLSWTHSKAYHCYGVYGEEDSSCDLDYYFWLVRNGNRTVLVDCGFDDERGGARNRLQQTSPLELLSRMGTRAEDVDHVVLSHMHYDHIGNIDLFPNATFSIARAELEYWTGPYSDRPTIAWPVESEEVRMVQQLAGEERLELVENSHELFPGLVLTKVPGHTPGQLVAEVNTDGGRLVLASDAVHFYDEMNLDRPFSTFHDLAAMYRSYEMFRDLDARPDTLVVPGHDPDVTRKFEVAADQCIDLTKPVDLDERTRSERELADAAHRLAQRPRHC